MYEEIKTACLYLRYSSSNQTEQSIEGQMHVCQDFCKRHNIRIVEMYIDRATSASKDIEKRVEFLKRIQRRETSMQSSFTNLTALPDPVMTQPPTNTA